MPRNLTRLSPADLSGERRRRESSTVYDPWTGDTATVGPNGHICIVAAHEVGPDDLELAAALRAARGIPAPRRQEEAEALRAATEAVRKWQDEDDALRPVRPMRSDGTRPGPAQGHTLRRKPLPVLRWLAVGIVVGTIVVCAVALAKWTWQDVAPVFSLRGEA